MRKRAMKWLALFMTAALLITSFNFSAFVLDVQAGNDDVISVSGNYTFNPGSTWDEKAESNINYQTDVIPQDGTTLEMDILLPDTGSVPDFSGLIKTVGILRIGSSWDWIQSNVIQELKATDFSGTTIIEGDTYYKASVSIPFEGTVGANVDGSWNGSVSIEKAISDVVKAISVKFAGYECDYSGNIYVANVRLTNLEGSSAVTTEILKEWNFDNGIGGWENAGWNYQYNGETPTVSANNGMLEVKVDYSNDKSFDWSQIGIREWGDINLVGANKASFDFYYDPALLDGGFKIKSTIQYADGSEYLDTAVADVTVNTEDAVDAGNGLKKATVELSFDNITAETCCNTVICIIGYKTSYQGSIFIDNLKIMKETSAAPDYFVDSTVVRDDKTRSISVNDGKLVTSKANGDTEATSINKNIKLVDKNATKDVKAIYAYLQAMGASESVIYGHQNDTWHKAGSGELSNSDTKDVTNSISGVVGIDTLSLTGNEYSAKRFNSEIGTTTFPQTAEGNVQAAAALTNITINEGAIITLSAHMPNFANVKEVETYNEQTDPTYAKYDFSGYTPNVLTGDVMNQILPGGQYHEKYNAYLDMIAAYADGINGPVLFRPFHENTGSWFWWGAAFCDATTYKNVWKYTVEYLRDDKDVHNLLYVYGPGSEAADVEEYGERYPGDNYVDMIGFDIYNEMPGENNEATWFVQFKQALKIVEDFGAAHGKLIAVTETGIKNETQKGENQTALLKSGNAHKDWYNAVLNTVADSDASFFLLWANFGEKDGFYTPYVKEVKDDGVLFGHEMLDDFISFYNDGRSVLAENQKTVLATLANTLDVTVENAGDEATGYFVSPVSGKRILEPIAVSAKVNSTVSDNNVEIVFNGNGVTKKVKAQLEGRYYSAQLTEEVLASLGEYVGSIDLYINGKKADSIRAIFNIKPPVEDPYEIDGFENYLGVDALLTQAWTTNKAAGSKINLGLSKEAGKVYSGEYAMKFVYEETQEGWAGATINKKVDWSGCDALQFYTIPDGLNQKVVVQLTANGTVYEVYLNTYDQYRNQKNPLLITIPFSEFVQRDTAGNPKGGLVQDSSKVTQFGLWVNAVKDTPVFVDGKVSGTIYYDNITAVKSGASNVVFKDLTITDKPGPGEITPEKPVNQAALNITGVGSTLTFGKSANLKVSGGSGSGAVTYAVTSGSKYATVDASGKVLATGIGSVTITATKAGDAKYNPTTATITFKTVMPKKNTTITVKNGKYKVVSTTKKKEALAYIGPVDKTSKKVTVSSSVKIGSKTYKVTSIGKNAFKSCKKLTSVTIGKNVTVIGDGAFESCAALTKITIPANVTTIGKKAFYKDSKLKNIIIKSKKLKKVGSGAFKGINKKAKMKVPSSKLTPYKKLLKGKGQAKTVKITK